MGEVADGTGGSGTNRLGRDRLVSDLARLALDAINLGVVITDRHGRRIYSNAEADRLLGNHSGALHIVRGNRIGAAARETHKLLYATIERVCAGEGRGTERHHILASAADDQRPDLAVCISPVAADGAAGGGSAMILLRTIERACDMEIEGRRLFGLTRMQAKFASSIASGLSLTEAARIHAVTLATARTHMKAIFRKTGVCRQSQVAAIMRGVQTPIRPVSAQADAPSRMGFAGAPPNAAMI